MRPFPPRHELTIMTPGPGGESGPVAAAVVTVVASSATTVTKVSWTDRSFPMRSNLVRFRSAAWQLAAPQQSTGIVPSAICTKPRRIA